MLETEPYDREFNDDATGGRADDDLNPAVPAAVFQPPPVVFQPPAARDEPPRSQATAAAVPGSPSPAGTGRDTEGSESPRDSRDDDDGAGAGRRRRRRPSRGRPRTADADADAAAETEGAGGGQPETQVRQGASRDEEPQQAQSGASATPADGARPDGAGPDGARAGGDARPAEPQEAGDAADAPDKGDGEAGGARRRRRKRRRGSAEGAPGADSLTPDDPPDTVVHVREPNGGPAGAAGSASSDVRSVKGSTRLEAKKQRRREGRETGRRRPPVITESEFLARRESVERTMVVRQRKDRTQIAALEDGVLVEHYVNRSSHQSYVGNVYLGKVQNVLPSMEAAFVDIGKGRNAVLYAGEVNFDVSGLEGQPKRIESALKAGQSVVVQVTKDPVGHKGARLTSLVSLPGRYLVYVPGASMTGISRKLPDTERNRLKQILKKVMPENAGVIVRTAAEGAAAEELSRDVARLAAQWEAIEKKAKTASAPALLYSEPDLTIRVIRDVFNEDFSRLVVSGDEAWDVVDEYIRYVAPHLADRVTRWEGERDAFAEYRIDEQLAKALERKVWLPSGGSLVIDKTEAMTVIDVNTGKFTGQGGNLEETVTRNNLEAAEEIVRQLRLRDVGGIVVIDFIDMVLESNRELVLRRLLECLARDRTKHQVAEVTSLGLVQMTRKRVGAGLLEAFSTPCECCNGRGVILTFDPDADSHATHHTHPRGSGARGSGQAAVPSPASVAARARPADVQPAEAPPADVQPAEAQPADAPPTDAQAADSQAGTQADARTEVVPAGPAPGDPAHTDNGQVTGGTGEPGRSGGGGRRRRRKAQAPAGAAAPASSAAAPASSAGAAGISATSGTAVDSADPAQES